jgi:peptidoglycan/LPS O-acetylase OafA/YrhL
MEKTIPATKFYRPELDGLRFFAFFLVFLQHLPLPDGHFGPWTAAGLFFSLHLHGWMGVDLFLCLSAYLIAKLLRLEWEAKGGISVKHFYIRRIFRIWPLYFLACFLGFFALPFFGYFAPSFSEPAHRELIRNYLGPYLGLAGNWAVVLHGYPGVMFLKPLWTISLEEQFYIAGPILLALTRFEKKAILKLSGLLLILTFAARAEALMMGTHFPTIWVCTLTRLDPFILGTCLAVFEEDLILLMRKFSAGGIALAGFAMLGLVVLLSGVEQQTMNDIFLYFFLDLGFCCLIFSTLRFDGLKIFFSFRPWVELGKISYGLYVYHILAYCFTISFLLWLRDQGNIRLGFFNLEAAYLLIGLAVTIGISFISYRFFEKVFLNLKNRFTAIESRPV